MKRIVVFALVLNAALLGVVAHQLVAIAGGGAVATVNGDVNGDGWLNIADPVFMLNFLYSGGPAPVAFAGGPDHTAEIAELRGELSAHVEMLRSDVDAVTAGSASNAAAIATNSTDIAINSTDIAINSTDIAINATAVADLTANPAGGLSDEQSEMLGHMSIMQLAMDREGNTATTIRFSGVNVQVVNGTGSTDGTVNGLGNLVIGYQEFRPDDGVSINDRRGSHNLVVGKENNYSNGSWAGQVVGWHNTISGHLSTVSGGYNNRAVEQYCTVGGGRTTLLWVIVLR